MTEAFLAAGSTSDLSIGGRTTRSMDRLFAVVQAIAAALVVVDLLLLLGGVVSRYVFDRPLAWSDELAVICFLWIVMLGAAIAARTESHMRLTVVVSRLAPDAQRFLETFASVLTVFLMVCLFMPAIDHARDHWTTLTPSLSLSDGVRLLALVVGIVLIVLAVVPRMIATSSIRHLMLSFILIAVVAAALEAIRPLLQNSDVAAPILFFGIGVVIAVLIGVPIAFAFGIVTLAFLQFSTTIPLSIIVARVDGGISEPLLLSIPMFIVLGYMLGLTGMATRLIAFLTALIGHIRGGLNYVLLGAMFLVSGISGSKAADIAAVAPVLLPEMKRRGYRDSELVALLASSGGMTETIPPSLVLIALGAVAGVSIKALFAAGVLPAAVGAVALVAVAWWRARRSVTATSDRATKVQIIRTLAAALPVLALPLLIRLAVVEGIATATEVATLGVAYTLVVGLVLAKQTEWKKIYPMLTETASLSGVVMLIVGMATAMAWALTQSGFSNLLVDWMVRIPGGRAGFMLVSILIFVVLGSLLEGLPALVVLAPLLFPAAQTFGIHDVHYSMVVILSMGLGLFAPPFGVGYYMACVIGNLSPDAGMRAIWTYLSAIALVTLLVAFVPWFSLAFV